MKTSRRLGLAIAMIILAWSADPSAACCEYSTFVVGYVCDDTVYEDPWGVVADCAHPEYSSWFCEDAELAAEEWCAEYDWGTTRWLGGELGDFACYESTGFVAFNCWGYIED